MFSDTQTAMINTKITRPSWIKVKAPTSQEYIESKKLINELKLNTVCEEAACPNIGECWKKKHVTVMILGSTCTRACAFCNVKTGKPDTVDEDEPRRIAISVSKLGLKHVVITSVDRDDLEDGGATHFTKCIKEIRTHSPSTTIEILTPDFLRKERAIDIILSEIPDVFNHNIETVPSLYNTIRPGARYFNSLKLLHEIKKRAPKIFTKSGIMLGLGETDDEVMQVMDDLRSASVDFITIGQYLQPTKKHANVARYVTNEGFEFLGKVAKAKGFLMVSSSPLTRSSYHADTDFLEMKRKRELEIKS